MDDVFLNAINYSCYQFHVINWGIAKLVATNAKVMTH